MQNVRPDIARIRDFWEKSARAPLDADGLRPTARDPFLQEVVEATIERHLAADAMVYDIGCGDGLSTLRFAPRVRAIVGLDYVDAFVEAARRGAADRQIQNAVFEQGDVLNLAPVVACHGLTDVGITIRCLVNLPTWEDQKAALGQIANAVKPGGLYILSEGWSEGLEALNRTRRQAGLADIGAAKYNLFISRSAFEREIAPAFEIVAYESLGLYLFASRVLQPVVAHPAPPSHKHEINRAAAELSILGVGREAFEDLDYAGIYVLRRRG